MTACRRRDPGAHGPVGADFPFLHRMATQLRDHDDRDQFLAGVDLILTGITR